MKYLIGTFILIILSFTFVFINKKNNISKSPIVGQASSFYIEDYKKEIHPSYNSNKCIPEVITKIVQACQGNDVSWKIPPNVKSITIYYKNRSNEPLFSRVFDVEPNHIISLKANK